MDQDQQNDQQDAGQVWAQESLQQPPEDAADQPTGDKLDARGKGFNIRQCAACDGAHNNLVLNEYVKQQAAFTHWYMCPTVHDPVGVSLMMLKSGDALELSGNVCQALARAQLAGKWLVAIFRRDESGLHLDRTAEKFDTIDFFGDGKNNPGCIGLLRQNFESEVGPQQPEQMKEAPPRSLKSMIGDAITPLD